VAKILKSSVWIPVALAAVLFGAAAIRAPGEHRGPCVVLSGADSTIADARCVRITTLEDWAALWREHQGLPPRPKSENRKPYEVDLPQVDFTTHVVIGVFEGETVNSRGLTAVALESAEGRSILRYESQSYQTMEEVDHVRPYGFFVLPRTGEALDLEEQLGMPGGASRIEPRQSFPALP